jgi:hypothetical protein
MSNGKEPALSVPQLWTLDARFITYCKINKKASAWNTRGSGVSLQVFRCKAWRKGTTRKTSDVDGRIGLKMRVKEMKWGCRPDSCCSEQRPVADDCEWGNKSSCYT